MIKFSWFYQQLWYTNHHKNGKMLESKILWNYHRSNSNYLVGNDIKVGN